LCVLILQHIWLQCKRKMTYDFLPCIGYCQGYLILCHQSFHKCCSQYSWTPVHASSNVAQVVSMAAWLYDFDRKWLPFLSVCDSSHMLCSVHTLTQMLQNQWMLCRVSPQTQWKSQNHTQLKIINGSSRMATKLDPATTMWCVIQLVMAMHWNQLVYLHVETNRTNPITSRHISHTHFMHLNV
jgi:hypothetical protein